MSVKRKRVVIGLAVLVMVCLAGSLVVYKVLFPVPPSVKRLIDEDVYNRVLIGGALIIPESQGFIGLLIPDSHDSKLHLIFSHLFPDAYADYSYQIEMVKHLNIQYVEYMLPDSKSVTEVLCVTVQVKYRTSIARLEIFNYLGEKFDGEWSVTFLDNREGTCR